jgi:RimJ/RimL family protein N-acetyltransferase
MEQFFLKDGREYIIRKTKATDANSMIEYVYKIGSESDNLTFGKGEINITLAQEEEFLESFSNKVNSLHIIAELDGMIIGSLNFTGGGRPRLAHTGEFGVSVLKEFWGQGVGTSLVEYLIDWSKATGIVRKINLRVRTDNFSAIRVYKKLGFIEEGRITREFIINGEFYDLYSMGLAID